MTSNDTNNRAKFGDKPRFNSEKPVSEQDKRAIYFIYEAEQAKGVASKNIYKELAKRYDRSERHIQRYIKEIREKHGLIVEPTTEEKRAHRDKLVRIAKALLSNEIASLKHIQNGEYELDDKQYYPFTTLKKPASKQIITELLKSNLKYTIEEASSFDLFDDFRSHLAAEKSDNSVIEDWIENDPAGLVDILKRLVKQKNFQGKCPVCQNW